MDFGIPRNDKRGRWGANTLMEVLEQVYYMYKGFALLM